MKKIVMTKKDYLEAIKDDLDALLDFKKDIISIRLKISGSKKKACYQKLLLTADAYIKDLRRRKPVKLDKIVRDKIPEIIRRDGRKPITKVLSEKESQEELLRKLHEEVKEFEESKNVEELADILEVIYALALIEGVEQKQLEQIREKKRMEKGGFEKRIYLIETQI